MHHLAILPIYLNRVYWDAGDIVGSVGSVIKVCRCVCTKWKAPICNSHRS